MFGRETKKGAKGGSAADKAGTKTQDQMSRILERKLQNKNRSTCPQIKPQAPHNNSFHRHQTRDLLNLTCTTNQVTTTRGSSNLDLASKRANKATGGFLLTNGFHTRFFSFG